MPRPIPPAAPPSPPLLCPPGARRPAAFAPLLGLLAAAAACGTPKEGGSGGVDCSLLPPEGAPLVRVPVGSVRALPSPADPACAPGEAWTVRESPGENDVVVGADGLARFVPDAAGRWVFALGEAIELEVEVVDEAPFHNLHHPPSRSLVAVGDELWVAQGYAPRLTRLALADLSSRGEVAVGAWPVALAATPDGATVLVAQAGDDHLGVVDVASGRMVDAIWVGDEPAGIAVSPDGGTAYVALSTVEEVAVVDLGARARVGALPAPVDARAMALSADGAVLFVAGHRTGAPERYPFESADPADDRDLLAVSTASGEVLQAFTDLASVITDLELDEAGGRLWVTGTISHPERGLVTVASPPFEGVLIPIDLGAGEVGEPLVFDPSEPGGGMVLGPQAVARDGDTLWVAAEGSSLVIAVDAATLEERGRVPVQGHPRDLIAVDGQVLVHGSADFVVSRVELAGVQALANAGDDPRPAEVAAGHKGFISPGESYGANYSCNSCHVDGRGDARVWPAGPFQEWEASRAMFWLEGTAPLGWSGYVADVRDFGYTGYTSIIAKWPTSEQAEDLAAFLGSLMPPPAANSHTTRAGGLSEQGQRGEALFTGAAACASCHPGPLSTDNGTLPEGLTPKKSNTPSLVGAYRHNVWLKRADAPTLRGAVEAALEATGVGGLSEAEVDDLTRYLQEMTDRDLFLLAQRPLADAGAVGAAGELALIFNQPIWDAAENLERVELIVDGARVDAEVQADGRRLDLVPAAPIPANADVELIARAGLLAFDGRALPADARVAFTTAAAPALRMDGEYQLVVDLPAIDFANAGFDRSRTLPITSELLAVSTADGAALDLDLGDGLRWTMAGVIDGSTLHVPAAPLSFGFSLAQGGALEAELIDEDGDGVADSASGTMVMSGPAFYEEGITWTLRRPARDCTPGPSGALAVDVTVGDDGLPVISWGDDGALGLYVTEPGATLPLGPGQVVSGGQAFWALQASAFPSGFPGPVRYGDLPPGADDVSVANGAPAGGAALEPGVCYQFSVISDGFALGSYSLVWE